jgi:signal transduction histidine kinase
VLGLTGPDALALLAAASTILLAIVAIVAFSARRTLRRAAERSRLGERVLDAVSEAVFVVDALRPGRPNIHVNTAYSALTGYGASEAVAANFEALSIFADPAKVVALDNRTEAATDVRVGIRRRDGTTCPAKLDLRVLQDDGERRYIVGLLETDDSGEHAADRTSTVPPAGPASASADASCRATDAFFSWLIHELRSPLNACFMWLDVLALAPQQDKLAKAVEAMKRSLARQARLVSDLNDAAKITSAGETRIERFDLVALLKRGLGAWQSLAAAKQLSFDARIGLQAGPVDGDPERLLQALNHVLDSAIGSTPTGGRLDLRVRGNGEACTVEVEDSGDALSAEDAANLFTPLWRGPTSAKGRSGLGLGLAVAHQIVVQHGGTLVASNGVAGARFVLTLPLAGPFAAARAGDTPA